jgi:glycosyltransferase A (GT-A) superfamily protein (DUF2064 family)
MDTLAPEAPRPARARVLVMAKSPEPGRTKTRLAPRVGIGGAALAARAMLLDTIEVALSASDVTLVLDGVLDTDLEQRVNELVASSGRAFDVVPQVEGSFDERLAAAFELGGVLVGMDTPQIEVSVLTTALAQLDAGRQPFVPSEDGGWCLLGLEPEDAALVRGVGTSSASTGQDQFDRLGRPSLLEPLRDVDTPEDADAVAALVPTSRFAALWQVLGGSSRSEQVLVGGVL